MKFLIKNPIFKIIGVVAILYFGVFSNKENPNNVANLLAPKTLEKNYKQAQERRNFIVDNLRKVDEYQKRDEDEVRGKNDEATSPLFN